MAVGALRKLKRIGRFFGELWRYMRARKKLWLAPIIMVLVAFGAFLVLTQGSVLAPFIYAMF